MGLNIQNKYKLEKGLTLWLTGLSGAGKSTITDNLFKLLKDSSPDLELEVLDGDEIREHLCKDLGFTKEDRFKNIERIAFLAGKISKHKVLVLVPVIAPYKEARDMARSLSGNFCEVFVKASLDTVIQRDVKGLYKKALNNEIKNFTGVSDPYEEPEKPEILIESDKLSIDDSVSKIIDYLVQNQYLKVN